MENIFPKFTMKRISENAEYVFQKIFTTKQTKFKCMSERVTLDRSVSKIVISNVIF